MVASCAHLLHSSGIDPGTFLNEPIPELDVPFWRYYRSKFLVIMDAFAWTRHLPKGCTVVAVHPGTISTNLFRYLDETYGRPLAGLIRLVTNVILPGPEVGARTVLFAALNEDVESGSYVEPHVNPGKLNPGVHDVVLQDQLWYWAEAISTQPS